ncbi:MAG: alkaline phosphatase family protein, partial [Candidatus Thorarchaeota archaeon]
ALDLEKAVYPKEIYETLRQLNYEIDIDSKLAHKQSTEAFLKDLFRIAHIRHKTYLYLWNKLDWDNFMFIITSSDRLGHFFWNVYEDKKNKNYDKFLQFFHFIDEIIGELYSRLNENDNFIILSDHGMELIVQNVYLNTLLEKEAYLELNNKFKNYNRITNRTKAFVLDPGRVYLNKEGYYPNGSITKEQENDLIDELKDLFLSFKYNNKKVIRKVYRKEEIYNGKMLDYAPDLILLENSGFRLRGTIGKKSLFESDIFSGKHNEEAFLFVNKDIDIKNPKVEDVISLMNSE